MKRKKKKHLRNLFFVGVGIIVASFIYVYIFAAYAVFPFSSRWRAYFGQMDTPNGYSIFGIDISHHQADIDWERLEKSTIGGSSISFIFVKATEGTTYLDENFNENFYQARRHGFIRGAYHYYLPTLPARDQAEHFLHQVHLEEGDLPPVLDIEETGGKSAQRLRRDALLWLQTVEKAYGVKPILYTSYKFKTSYLNTEEFESYPYWIAHYYVKNLTYEGEWRFWQYSDVGRLDGIREKVDFNIYNGSIYDLRQLTLRGEDEFELE
ncbi:MAG: glycoside hydrolase family 25 protein [Alloprevotella sp.]|nr:glycoside hydrolase family 25 protein [Alloprevotella sp.]